MCKYHKYSILLPAIFQNPIETSAQSYCKMRPNAVWHPGIFSYLHLTNYMFTAYKTWWYGYCNTFSFFSISSHVIHLSTLIEQRSRAAGRAQHWALSSCMWRVCCEKSLLCWLVTEYQTHAVMIFGWNKILDQKSSRIWGCTFSTRFAVWDVQFILFKCGFV